MIVPAHAHYAIQIAFGKEHGLAFSSGGAADPWVPYGGAMIPSRQPHSMDSRSVSATAVMFIEPETREGRVLTERHLAEGIAHMPDESFTGAQKIIASWEAGDTKSIVASCIDLIRSLTGDVQPLEASDERVLRAIAYINANLDRKLTLDEVAAAAILSPGRFRHLFVEQTGMALRPYILWRRFLKVWDLAMAGESLSRAAHSAGFADAAHFSRTSKRMFGLAPTMLRMEH
jgi:AraC-like DNA-binding protein